MKNDVSVTLSEVNYLLLYTKWIRCAIIRPVTKSLPIALNTCTVDPCKELSKKTPTANKAHDISCIAI